jgi:hypothetical protein
METGAINEIISSGGLQYIKNDSIRKCSFLVGYQSSPCKNSGSFLRWNLSKNWRFTLFDEQLINTRYLFSLNESTDVDLRWTFRRTFSKPLLKVTKIRKSMSFCIMVNVMLWSLGFIRYEADLTEWLI